MTFKFFGFGIAGAADDADAGAESKEQRAARFCILPRSFYVYGYCGGVGAAARAYFAKRTKMVLTTTGTTFSAADGADANNTDAESTRTSLIDTITVAADDGDGENNSEEVHLRWMADAQTMVRRPSRKTGNQCIVVHSAYNDLCNEIIRQKRRSRRVKSLSAASLSGTASPLLAPATVQTSSVTSVCYIYLCLLEV